MDLEARPLYSITRRVWLKNTTSSAVDPGVIGWTCVLVVSLSYVNGQLWCCLLQGCLCSERVPSKIHSLHLSYGGGSSLSIQTHHESQPQNIRNSICLSSITFGQVIETVFKNRLRVLFETGKIPFNQFCLAQRFPGLRGLAMVIVLC